MDIRMHETTIGILITVGVTAMISLIYYLVMKRKKWGMSYRHRRITITQFKLLDGISLEEYIALLPRVSTSANLALLAEMDRQGKINIKEKGFEILSDDLTNSEWKFLEALRSENTNKLRYGITHDDATIVNPIWFVRSDPQLKLKLINKGLIVDNDKNTRVWPVALVMVIPVVIAMIIIGVSGLSFSKGGAGQVLLSVLLLSPFTSVVSMMIISAYLSNSYLYTPKGVEVLDYYAGLKKYLKHAEKERNAFFQNTKESDFLEMTPYLILFGLEGPWTKRLRRYRLAMH